MIQRLKVLKDMKYGTRMLRAGETVEMKGPDVRLYRALGAVGPLARETAAPVVAPAKPKAPRKARRKK